MSGTELMLKSLGIAHRVYMAWKFERLFQKAEAHGMTEEELCNNDQRFALFMRVGRAFEICSSKEAIDFIADAMLGGIKSGDADKKPDYVQMAIQGLSGVTNTELTILVIMNKHNIALSIKNEMPTKKRKEKYIEDACGKLKVDDERLAAMTNSLIRTGLVTPPSSGYGGYVAHNSNLLTPLARDVFQYVDYSKRLTT